MRYRTLTLPSTEMDALVGLIEWGAAHLDRRLNDEERRAFNKLHVAASGEKLPGHAPGKPHRGPDLDLTNRHNTHRKAAP